MATKGGKDALIDIPAGGGTVTYTETQNGGFLKADGPTSGVSGVVKPGGALTASGGKYANSNWRVDSNSTLNFTNTTLSNSEVTGNENANKLGFGGTASAKSKANVVSRFVSANMAGGDDSISFAKRSAVKNSSFDLGQGADSITFARGARAAKTDIDLGVDQDVDRVRIARLKDMKKVVIDNFDKGDTLKIGGKTYEYNDLQDRDGKFGKNLKVNLD